MPLTRFCMYCTTSEKRKAKAEADTSAVRVLLRGLSYIFGRDKGFGVPVVADGPVGREKRGELFVGDSNSAEEDERTEKRDGGCADMKEMRLCVSQAPTRIGGCCARAR
jgi:hypothetical protein